MQRTAPIVEVDGIVKDFRPGMGLRRKRVLQGISFEVQRGEVFGFLGPNGAGKTTTLKVLMGLIHPDAGHARVLGHDVGKAEYRRHVGFLPENPSFYDYLTGEEFLDFYARVSGVPQVLRCPRIERLLGEVGLPHARTARLRTYSKGMLQRIGIAQAIIHDPEIVFLDEPMSGLDPIGRKEVRDLILRLHSEGKTIFMNSHVLSDVEALCHRVAILVKGQIRFQGRVGDFLTERASDIVLQCVPPELALRVEERFGASISGQAERVELRVPEKRVPDVLQLAIAAGAEIHSVTPHRVSLEEVFLSAVHEEEDAR